MHVRFIFPKSSARTEPQLSSRTSYTRPGPARGCCSERGVCRWSRCASSSPSLPPPPAARRRFPGVSSSSSGLCSSPARLLPLSAAAQLGDSPAAAAALPPQYQHRNAGSAKPRERTKSNPVGVSLTCSPARVDPFHGGRARAHVHGGETRRLTQSRALRSAFLLQSFTKLRKSPSPRTDTPTARSIGLRGAEARR